MPSLDDISILKNINDKKILFKRTHHYPSIRGFNSFPARLHSSQQPHPFVESLQQISTRNLARTQNSYRKIIILNVQCYTDCKNLYQRIHIVGKNIIVNKVLKVCFDNISKPKEVLLWFTQWIQLIPSAYPIQHLPKSTGLPSTKKGPGLAWKSWVHDPDCGGPNEWCLSGSFQWSPSDWKYSCLQCGKFWSCETKLQIYSRRTS